MQAGARDECAGGQALPGDLSALLLDLVTLATHIFSYDPMAFRRDVAGSPDPSRGAQRGGQQPTEVLPMQTNDSGHAVGLDREEWQAHALEYARLEVPGEIEDVIVVDEIGLHYEHDGVGLASGGYGPDDYWWVIGGVTPMNIYDYQEYPTIDEAKYRHYDLLLEIADPGSGQPADVCIPGNDGHPWDAVEIGDNNIRPDPSSDSGAVYTIGECRDCGDAVEVQWRDRTIRVL
jgi:hypothetical protein